MTRHYSNVKFVHHFVCLRERESRKICIHQSRAARDGIISSKSATYLYKYYRFRTCINYDDPNCDKATAYSGTLILMRNWKCTFWNALRQFDFSWDALNFKEQFIYIVYFFLLWFWFLEWKKKKHCQRQQQQQAIIIYVAKKSATFSHSMRKVKGIFHLPQEITEENLAKKHFVMVAVSEWLLHVRYVNAIPCYGVLYTCKWHIRIVLYIFMDVFSVVLTQQKWWKTVRKKLDMLLVQTIDLDASAVNWQKQRANSIKRLGGERKHALNMFHHQQQH